MSINVLVSSNQFAIKEYIVQFYDNLFLEMFIRRLKLDDLTFDFIDAEEARRLFWGSRAIGLKDFWPSCL
jgi:hypothetical protein